MRLSGWHLLDTEVKHFSFYHFSYDFSAASICAKHDTATISSATKADISRRLSFRLIELLPFYFDYHF